MQMRYAGVIKTFDQLRGYGFLTDSSGEDHFFHVTKCLIPQDEIVRGVPVEFGLVEDRKQPGRYRAIDVDAAEVTR